MEAHRYALRRILARPMLKNNCQTFQRSNRGHSPVIAFDDRVILIFPGSLTTIRTRGSIAGVVGTVVETDNTSMADNYIIETSQGAAGLVVRSGRGFMFFSAKKEFDVLEGQLFTSPARAVKAAIGHETRRGTRFTTPRNKARCSALESQ